MWSVALGCLLCVLMSPGVAVAEPPSAPAPTVTSPEVVAPTTLEAIRIKGETKIVPSDIDKVAFSHAGKKRMVTAYKLCIDSTGTPSLVQMLKPSGLPDYDAKIQAEMSKWRYRPYTVNGVAKPVCSSVTFIYTQEGPPDQEIHTKYRAVFNGNQLQVPSGQLVPLQGATLATVQLLTRGPRAPRDADNAVLELHSLDQRYKVFLVAKADALALVARTPLVLADSETAAPPQVDAEEPGCRLRRGAPVQILQRQGEMLRVSPLLGTNRPTGLVRAGDLAKSFEPVAEESLPAGEWVKLPARRSLRSSPGGPVLPALTNPQLPTSALMLRRKSGHALVMVEDVTSWCLGWVPVAGLKPGPAPSRPTLAVRTPSQPTTQASPPLRLLQGSLLLNTPGGDAVAKVTKEHEANAVETKNGYSKIAIETALGVLHLWAAGTP